MATATATTFNYQVRDRAGKLVSGSLEADSQAAVAQKLRSLGYAPVAIEQQKDATLQKEIRIPGFGAKVKLADLAVFSRQFATMINSGLSLIRALSILREQTENTKLAETIDEIRNQVEAGTSLSEALAEHDDVFPKLYVAMVRAGETAGMLDAVLLRIAETLEKDVALRRKIKAAMTYPVIVFIMAVLLTTAMLIFIVPVFAGMFEDLGGELPLPTQILQTTSQFLKTPLGIALYIGIPTAAWQGYKALRKNEKGRFQLDVIKLKLPVFGPLFRKIALSRFSRNLGTLLRAGVPILQAMTISSDIINNVHYRNSLTAVHDAVRDGESVTAPMQRDDIFPVMLSSMVEVGEETGQLPEMLNQIADNYDEDIDNAVSAITSIIEPVLIVFLAVVVGFIVIALFLPIIGIMQNMGG